jgi:hypothetical protein
MLKPVSSHQGEISKIGRRQFATPIYPRDDKTQSLHRLFSSCSWHFAHFLSLEAEGIADFVYGLLQQTLLQQRRIGLRPQPVERNNRRPARMLCHPKD